VSEIIVSLKTPHPKQQEFLDNRVRFNVLKCGRRFGKTEVCQELFSEIIELNQFCGYWSPTYKDLYEVWQETKRLFKDIIIHISETVKQIIFYGGAKLDFWSMEDPDSGRGRKYHRAIVDECEKALKFEQAWLQTIRATLTDFSGDGYFLSTPKFGDTYFKKMAKFELTDSNWKTFVYSTYDNPYISREELEATRLMYANNPLIFDCEYMAMDVDGMSLNPFAHAFNQDIHVSDRAIFQPNKRVYVSIDFNLNPFAVTFSHIWRDSNGLHDHTFMESAIENGSVPAMAKRIKELLGRSLANCVITGDAMGRNRNIAETDNASNYQLLKRLLNLPDSAFYVKSNPTHDRSRNDTNYTLFAATQPEFKFEKIIHPKNCPGLIADYKTVQCDAFGHILKRDRKDVAQRADFLDTERYKIHYFIFPEIDRIAKSLGLNRK